jgi:hypothetical protein
MKNTIILLITATIMLISQACGDDCGKTTYRKELGIGYVFMYDTSNNVSYPVEGVTVIVDNIYDTPGLFGKNHSVAEESYTTDAEGRYQVRFIEKGCFTYPDGTKEMNYCNLYRFYCNGKKKFGFYIENNVQNNIITLDTIKLYK